MPASATGRNRLLPALVLLLITVAVYLPVHRHPFFNLDDGLYVVGNEHVMQGLTWSTVRWSFTAFDRSNWVPLAFMSHALDYQLFGSNPAGHHDVSMLLQALNAVFLFWMLAEATGAPGRSFAVAALFAVHPLNVEAVAWIAERKTVLSMVFFLLALGAWRRYALRPGPGRYALVAALFALGLCAKAQIITLPFVLLLWDYWPLERVQLSGDRSSPAASDMPQKRPLWLLLEKLPLLALCVLAAIATFYSEHEARPRLWPPLSERIANAVYSYARYVGKTFWPSALAPLYPNRGATLTLWEIGGSLAFVLAVTAFVILARRRRYLPVGWFLFLGTLVPMLEIVQFGKEGMADRFAYQALIGLLIMVCWGVADLADNLRIPQTAVAAVACVAVLALGITARHQVNYWSDDVTLWRHAVAVVPGHWQAEDEVGVALIHAGAPEADALPYFAEAARLHPDDLVSNMHLAIFNARTGHPREAIAHYEKVLLTPLPPAIASQVYRAMGILYTQMGDRTNAARCYDQAITVRLRQYAAGR